MNKTQLTQYIKDQSQYLGFSGCGISKAEFLAEEAPHLEQWLAKMMHGEMRYMENHFDKRLDPTLLVPGAKSIISLTYNYFTQKKQKHEQVAISKYAYGEDYHFVVKEKLKELFSRICEKTGNIEGRVFVDSAPVLDKAWARKSNLGWIGKNANLIHPRKGSYFFVAEVICDLDLEYESQPMKDYCGKCTRCIDACPTQAIVNNKIVDGSKCISYFTIELKNEIPQEYKQKLGNWLFGCDVCQDVCPWNRFSISHQEKSFEMKKEIGNWTPRDWYEMTEEIFAKVFSDSPLSRTGFERLKKTLRIIARED